jgi:solute carrier family 24 (sodium/potassium/calcium exchanger), member 6
VLAFIQSAVWLSLIADEVVALISDAGDMLGISEDLLGATVLAWGETVPDVLAMAAVARAGARLCAELK